MSELPEDDVENGECPTECEIAEYDDFPEYIEEEDGLIEGEDAEIFAESYDTAASLRRIEMCISGLADWLAAKTEQIDEKIEKNTDVCRDDFSKRLSELEQLFEKRIMHTDHEEKIVDEMHKELTKYKEDMYSQLVRPILLDIIEVRDSIMRVSAAYLNKAEGERDIPNKTFADYAYDLQDILEKNNVEIFRSAEGDTFAPIRQRTIKKVITHDETMHGKIAESVSCGYSYGGRVISAEKVYTYVYEPAEEIKDESEEDING